MNTEQLGSILSILLYGSIGIALIYGVLHFAVLEYRNWKNGQQPVRTERAVVYQKHTEKALVSQGRSSGDVFFVTFYTDSGEIVNCYMGYENYYILHEGDAGQLTWQGSRFGKFVPEICKEVL